MSRRDKGEKEDDKGKGEREMVKIRLQRVGTKKKPVYRVVVADSRAPRDGSFIETIGHYNPLTNPATTVINEAKVLEWLNRGAKPTQTVASLLNRSGISHKQISASLRKPSEHKPAEKKASSDDKSSGASDAKPAAAS